MAAARPPAHASANSGEATAFASGETSDACAKSAAEAGTVATPEDSVSASASRRKRGTRKGSASSHAQKSRANSTIPSVEPAESANDTDTAVRGEAPTASATTSARAFSGAGRRRAKTDERPATAMAAARAADTGAPANTR